MTFNYQVPKLYRTVVDDVISNVRESFLDDGVDDQVLMELKQLWESKLHASKAVEPLIEQPAALTVPRNMQHQAISSVQHSVLGPGQVPVFAQIPGISRQPATITLPAMYGGQQFAGQQILQTDHGTLILQAPGTQVIRGQIGSDGQVQHVLQTGQRVNTTSSGMIQLDGSTDQGPQSPETSLESKSKLAKSKKSNSSKKGKKNVTKVLSRNQVDGEGGSSSDDDEEDDEDDDKDEDDDEEKDEEAEGVEEEPLNSDDDVSEDDPSELFDTDNVIVCQYDKINRCKNKWKFGLKDGIMNLNGRDYVFQRASGDAEW